MKLSRFSFVLLFALGLVDAAAASTNRAWEAEDRIQTSKLVAVESPVLSAEYGFGDIEYRPRGDTNAFTIYGKETEDGVLVLYSESLLVPKKPSRLRETCLEALFEIDGLSEPIYEWQSSSFRIMGFNCCERAGLTESRVFFLSASHLPFNEAAQRTLSRIYARHEDFS